ncbi:MAG: hypothetical protein MUO19_06585, partial [Dehalococcoidales bacterium]|nr:hypothetical protein [Dehalococcoidales bacterium]
MSFKWENVPDTVHDRVNDIVKGYRFILNDKLAGFYLHGSLAMGCYTPRTSDMDFLAVVRKAMTIKEKRAIIGLLSG